MIHCILVRTLIRCFPGEETAGNVCIFAGMFGIKGLQVSEQGCAIPVIQCSFAADTSACYTEVQIPASEYIEVGIRIKLENKVSFSGFMAYFVPLRILPMRTMLSTNTVPYPPM